MFGHNSLRHLDQLLETDASISFSCVHCEMESIAFEAFHNVPNIFRINLSWNKLTGATISIAFNKLQNVFEVDLSNNQIDSIQSTTFNGMENLRYLSLRANPLNTLTSDTSAALAAISQTLQFLDLSYTNIDSLPDNVFNKEFAALQKFNLQGNRLATVPESLGLLTSLQELNIGSNLFTELNDESFLGLNNLRNLFIDRLNDLKKIHVGTFKHMAFLETLSCSHNKNLKEFNLGELIMAKDIKYVSKTI